MLWVMVMVLVRVRVPGLAFSLISPIWLIFSMFFCWISIDIFGFAFRSITLIWLIFYCFVSFVFLYLGFVSICHTAFINLVDRAFYFHFINFLHSLLIQYMSKVLIFLFFLLYCWFDCLFLFKYHHQPIFSLFMSLFYEHTFMSVTYQFNVSIYLEIQSDN